MLANILLSGTAVSFWPRDLVVGYDTVNLQKAFRPVALFKAASVSR